MPKLEILCLRFAVLFCSCLSLASFQLSVEAQEQAPAPIQPAPSGTAPGQPAPPNGVTQPNSVSPPRASSANRPTSRSSASRSRARGPSIATLGNGGYTTLARGGLYAAPVAISLGLGSDSAAISSSVGAYFGSAVHRNLLKTPEMLGDYRRPGSSIFFDPFNGMSGPGGSTGGTDPDDIYRRFDSPNASSFSGMRVSENNVALPQDRVWASYHHYHNAFAQRTNDTDLDRYIIGFEKTFNGGSSSLEFRLPIAGSLDPRDDLGFTAFAGGSFGNLDIIYKRVLLATDDRVIAAGLRVETPTGSKWHVSDTEFGNARYTYDPHAIYLTPYLGTLREFNEIWFLNSFLQLDIATGGDRLLASLNNNPEVEFRINQPPMLQIDIGGGVWLITPERDRVGWAAVNELHIATALDDDDAFIVDPTLGVPNIAVDQFPIRTLVNWTSGLHVQIDEFWSVRAGVSVPLLQDRTFDTEVMFQLNRNY